MFVVEITAHPHNIKTTIVRSYHESSQSNDAVRRDLLQRKENKEGEFWHSPWLEGLKPKDVAPSIFAISKLENFTIHKALEDDFWMRNLNMGGGISASHVMEFFSLWCKLQDVTLNAQTVNSISWKLIGLGVRGAT